MKIRNIPFLFGSSCRPLWSFRLGNNINLRRFTVYKVTCETYKCEFPLFVAREMDRPIIVQKFIIIIDYIVYQSH